MDSPTSAGGGHSIVGGGHLWTPSFYVGSAGNISAQTIQRYIELQCKHQDDDA
nr:transposase [Calidithermus roseus]